MSTAALQYFGRAVPTLLRTFPTISVLRIKPLKSVDSPVINELPTQCGSDIHPPSAPPNGDTIGPMTKYLTMEASTPEDGALFVQASKEDAEKSDGRVMDEASGSEKSFKSKSHECLEIPAELDGQLNLIIFGFGKKYMLNEMFSWYPLGRTMTVELSKKYNRPEVMELYTLFLFPRRYRLFHFWISWRYKKLIQAYAVNKVKVRETKKLKRLAEEAGLEDPDQFSTLTGPIPLPPDAVDEFGVPLDEEDRSEIVAKRYRAFMEYCQAVRDAEESWKFADGLISRTLVVYTNRKKFLDSMQLPDAKRTYAAVVNRDGKMFWFEHEKCTISKANDIFDRFKLDHMKIRRDMLPRRTDTNTKLYGRGPDIVSLRTPASPKLLKKEEQERLNS